ncbi:hypothetical protein P7K49_014216 [Saguinus oedipus]|uniref:Uncharacterized protein n=1 Tax=Saguinus oedipus TaxID=9490 RepID=A0ABQ9VI74_SAGOE|nr:hypothetical protein P7K49_014216 [Saguinus oedipus]
MQEEPLSCGASEETLKHLAKDPAKRKDPQPSPPLPGLLRRRRSGAALRPQRACSARLLRSRPAAAAAATAAVEEVTALHSTPLPPDAWRGSLSPYGSPGLPEVRTPPSLAPAGQRAERAPGALGAPRPLTQVYPPRKSADSLLGGWEQLPPLPTSGTGAPTQRYRAGPEGRGCCTQESRDRSPRRSRLGWSPPALLSGGNATFLALIRARAAGGSLGDLRAPGKCPGGTHSRGAVWPGTELWAETLQLLQKRAGFLSRGVCY